MPDITMCSNDNCIKKQECYRYTCNPNQYWQAYSTFEPISNEENRFKCKNYYPIVKRKEL